MAEIPARQATEAELAEWFTLKKQIADLQAKEGLLRSHLFKGFFPKPKEGSNTTTLSDGFRFKATHIVSRTIDEATLLGLWDEFPKQGINPNLLVRRKPELIKSAYNELTAEQQKFFDQALTVKDGSPQFEILPPAKPKGGK